VIGFLLIFIIISKYNSVNIIICELFALFWYHIFTDWILSIDVDFEYINWKTKLQQIIVLTPNICKYVLFYYVLTFFIKHYHFSVSIFRNLLTYYNMLTDKVYRCTMLNIFNLSERNLLILFLVRISLAIKTPSNKIVTSFMCKDYICDFFLIKIIELNAKGI
jgi:hypothetical protein